MRTLYKRNIDGKEEVRFIPSGNEEDFDEGIKFLPLGVDILQINPTELLEEISSMLNIMSVNIGNPSGVTVDEVNRSIYRSVIKFINLMKLKEN